METGILVTGGAGYIGSHVVRQLGERGERVVVLDNLSTGFRDAVLHGDLVVGDTRDTELVQRILADYHVETVMHFAAHIVVPESVAEPLRYYGNNTCASRNLLACCAEAGVEHVVFSSTAAVYGFPKHLPVDEATAVAPINPYGTSKLMTEWMLRDLAAAGGPRYVALRYFNVAGADPEARIGQSTPNATHLIKVACEAALGKRDHVSVFGTDYPTHDGTGVRDYIHVDDLADAHLKALNYLRNGGESTTLNVGYGHGYSVNEVLEAVARVHGKPLNVTTAARRPGDAAAIVAAADRIRDVLGWEPAYDDLDFIVSTALAWEKRLPGVPGPGEA